eukprot:3516664-Prymnesium_polylepis.1
MSAPDEDDGSVPAAVELTNAASPAAPSYRRPPLPQLQTMPRSKMKERLEAPSVDFLLSYFESDGRSAPSAALARAHSGDAGTEVDVTAGLLTTPPVWRRKALLAELENIVGPLSKQEHELLDVQEGGGGGGDDEGSSASTPLSTMMEEFALTLDGATDSQAMAEVLRASPSEGATIKREVGGAAAALARAFRGAA